MLAPGWDRPHDRGLLVRIVVTGALGHIGSRLVRELPRAFPEAEIVMIDNLLTQRYCSLFNLPAYGRYRCIEADVLTADLAELFEGAHAVIHLAAITNAAESFDVEEQVERVNVAATERVAQACLRTGSALIFPSTTSVYGPHTEVVDEDCPVSELRPQSPYASSKLRAERLLRVLGEDNGLRFVVCRFGTIFGSSPGMRFHTAVNKFCWQAVTGQPITVWRTAWHQERPYLDIGDGVEALIFILRRELFDGCTYNVVTLNATVGQIVEAIAAQVAKVRIEYVDSPIMNQLSYQVANDRFAGLGFDFRGRLQDGIGETVRLFEVLADANAVLAIRGSPESSK